MLSGGGTGGHVYPALAVVDELKKSSLQAVLYVGTAGGLESSIVSRAGVDFVPVRAAGLRGLSSAQALVNLAQLARGTAQAWGIVRRFRPDVVLATGGYASIPVVVAAWAQGHPSLVYLPDIQPGWAIRYLGRLAQRVAVSFDVSLGYFSPGKAVVTGYPVRARLFAHDRTAARQRLGLLPDERTLLVFGGSRGAHSINRAVSADLERLLRLAQMIHIAGHVDVQELCERREALSVNLRARYHLFEYLNEEMIDALLAADLAVARAGAATMGEFSAAGLASILVPYPYAGQHQDANANFMVERGAAHKLSDAEIGEGALVQVVERVLTDRDTLRSMSENACRLARPDAAQALAKQLAFLAGGA